jgi:hypothetical protein
MRQFDHRALLALPLLVMVGCAGRSQPDLAGIYRDEVRPAQSRVVDKKSMDVLARIYRRDFIAPLRRLDELTDDDVEAGFLAAYNAAFYAHYYDAPSHETYLLDTGRYFEELSTRGRATANYALFVHHLYRTARQFDAAESIRRDHPDANIPPVPPIITDQSFDPALPAVFTLPDGEEAFRLSNRNRIHRLEIIIVAGCEISKRAAREIYGDPHLGAAFVRGNATWLGSAEELDLDQVRRWNEAVPAAPLHVVYAQQPWSGIDFSAHPNFHFLVDGRLVASHSGWAPDSVPEPILDGLQAMGILAPPDTGRP